ncbi:MAG TPA: asparaginase, partial [Verrucomicrobiae bacterium]|nr:asparaginase [Verrucomicrobiae bacterium]
MPDSRPPSVDVIFTGGTISMGFDPAAGGPVPKLSGREILALTPGLEQIASLNAIDFDRLPGPHMTPPRMLELARLVASRLAQPDTHGVVITHGTDTLEETAYLLDLTLTGDKPVVFVGAMRNSSELSWDGPGNLRSAIRVAACPATTGLGVLVVMNDQLMTANDVIKSHTESVGTFQGRDFGALGLVDKDRVIVTQRRARREHIQVSRLEERVEIIKLSAGSDGRLVTLALNAGLRGLVIEGLGRGNAPVTAIEAVEQAVRANIPV